ncbi:innexin inx3 [Cimex lectularius]|uniref:Innexin n=1 Tax=Cimex lectularius TaxID=79782 RepID=A0A8I6S6A0_CIMLE|nr:innexin inx3 [Cimex lectularius]XP_014256871.1 innexin inx3 [Cimex lectularius]
MSVFALVSAVAGFVKIRYLVEKAVIDNIVFRLHYRVTSAILFLCCILVTANNLIGDPISCITDRAIPTHVINTFCWITYTFTLPGVKGKIGSALAHPGVANTLPGYDKRFHAYYQWVPFMLFFQGVLFYVPHWIWKNLEDGKIRNLTDGLRGANVVRSQDQQAAKTTRLVQYIHESLHRHNVYAAGYYICEIFNFANVIGNIFMIDSFLGGAFMTYGTEVIKFSGLNQEQRTDPMVEIFPRLTKCTFHKFGPSGTIQKHDTLCVLALNILNEKIYIFLWFWFIILAILSGLALVYSTAIILLPSIREMILIRRFRFGTPTGVSTLIRKTQVGDFLLLHFIGQNLNMMLFGELLDQLSRKLHVGNNLPTAPSTLELAPIYPSGKLRHHLETEA